MSTIHTAGSESGMSRSVGPYPNSFLQYSTVLSVCMGLAARVSLLCVAVFDGLWWCIVLCTAVLVFFF